MHDYQTDFIQLALENSVLRFGEFELKSGRISPYFFNAGLIRSGTALRRTGHAYVEAIKQSGVEFDMLFGPAYKGIPLGTAAAIAWSEKHGEDLPLVYNRKEAKTHGEGGNLVGGPLKGRVLVLDDVITAGTAVREVIDMIEAAEGAELAGIVVGLDRQERGQGALSAIQELQQRYGVPVISIISFTSLLSFMSESDNTSDALLQAMHSYRDSYGV